MRKRFSEIIGSKFYTVDNAGLQSIGKVTDLLIEDGTWNVRYLVVSTVVSLSSHVLISPAAIQKFDFNIKSIVTALTSQRVVDSPPLAADQPISRRQEQALVDYYGWPIYWLGQVVSKSKISKSAAAENASNAADEKRHSNLKAPNNFVVIVSNPRTDRQERCEIWLSTWNRGQLSMQRLTRGRGYQKKVQCFRLPGSTMSIGWLEAFSLTCRKPPSTTKVSAKIFQPSPANHTRLIGSARYRLRSMFSRKI